MMLDSEAELLPKTFKESGKGFSKDSGKDSGGNSGGNSGLVSDSLSGSRFSKRSRRRAELFLDIGASRIEGVIAAGLGSDSVDIIAHNVIANDAMNAGQIIDHKQFSQTLVALIDELEDMAGTRAEAAHLGISSPTLRFNFEEATRFIGGSVIREADLTYLTGAVRNLPAKPLSRVIYDALVDVSVDGTGGVFDAVGLFCHSLGVKMVRQSLADSVCVNLERIFAQIDLPLITIEHAACAAGIAALTETERKQGAILIDFGASTTSVVLFQGGHAQAGRVFPTGGNAITEDLAKGLPVMLDVAERIKCRHGSLALVGGESLFVINEERISSSWETSPITRQEISDIIEPRMSEIMDMIELYLDSSRHPAAMARSVVACGQVTQMKDFESYAKRRIDRCWRQASEIEHDGELLSPVLAGLLKVAIEGERDPFSGPLHRRRSVWQRLKHWLRYHV